MIPFVEFPKIPRLRRDIVSGDREMALNAKLREVRRLVSLSGDDDDARALCILDEILGHRPSAPSSPAAPYPQPSQLAAWLREYAQDAVAFTAATACTLESAAYVLEQAALCMSVERGEKT